MSKKVIVVSPAEIHDYFVKAYPNWDLQHPVIDFNQMWEELGNGMLSPESDTVIFGDFYYSEDMSELETAIATFAPAALVIVLSYDKELQKVIESNVNKIREATNQPMSKFYFANQESVLEDIAEAIKDFNSRNGASPMEAPSDAAVSTEEKLASSRPEVININALQAKKGETITNEDLPPLTQRGMIIASTSSKGGSGKTTVALCTASMLYHSSRIAAEKGLRDKPFNVCVVDMDVRDGQIGILIGADKPTVLNLFIEEKEPSVEFIKTKLVKHEGMGIYSLLAPRKGKTASMISNEYFQDVIYKLSTIFDIVILDTSVNYLDKLLGDVVLPIADQIMFVTNLSKGSIFGMYRWMDEMIANKSVKTYIDREKVGVVINQKLPNVGVDLDMIAKAAMDVPLLTAISTDFDSVLAATNEYRLQDIILKHPVLSGEYFRLAKRIVERIPKDDAYIVNPLTGDVAARKELKERLLAQTNLSQGRSDGGGTAVQPPKKGGIFK